MANDSLRKLYPLSAIFAQGEQPSPAKLSGISTQASAGFSIVSTAIGDLWNQAGDPVLSPGISITKNALHITSIGRAMGQMELLNQMVPGQGPLSGTMSYVDQVGIRYTTSTIAYTKYRPGITPSVGNVILGGTFAPLVQGQFQSAPQLILQTGDWSVDSNGKIYTYDPIPFGMTLTYAPTLGSDVRNAAGGNSPAWNVIPDPSTWAGNYGGIKISFANNTDNSTGYHIWLPPRKPLGLSKTINLSPETDNNIQASPDSGTFLMWQSDSSDAALTNGDHYRYNLPDEITGQPANTQLPGNFIYIWDETTGTILEGVSAFTPANIAHSKWKVRVLGGSTAVVFGNTLGNGIITSDTTQLPGDYVGRFKVITTGASLAKSLHSLYLHHFNHQHRAVDGSSKISHADLVGLVTPSPNVSNYGWSASNWANDDHIQYLHRGGSTDNSLTRRDQYDNAIWNELIIAYAGAGTDITTRKGISIRQTSDSAFLSPTLGGYKFVISTYGSTGFISFDSVTGNVKIAANDTNIARMINGTVSQLFFASEDVNTLPTDYLLFTKTKTLNIPLLPGFPIPDGLILHNLFDFVTDGSVNALTGMPATSSVRAGTLFSHISNASTFVASADPAHPEYGYAYNQATVPGREQYYTISPFDFTSARGIPQTEITEAYDELFAGYNAPFLKGKGSVSPTNPGPHITFSCPVRLPQDAVIDSTRSFMTVTYYCPTDIPAGILPGVLSAQLFTWSPHDVTADVTSTLFDFRTNVGGVNTVNTPTYNGQTYTIDNSTNIYILVVRIPPCGGSDILGKFYGATINYFAPRVNN